MPSAFQTVDCFKKFARLCDDGFAQGWHEANGGNLSYRMTEAEVAVCCSEFDEEAEWIELGYEAASLAGAHFMITGSGKYLRNVSDDPRDEIGIVQLDDTGSLWRLVWGFERGGRPSSELITHVMCHDVRFEATGGVERVVYHAHTPSITALSTVIEASSMRWTRALWQVMTESIIVFPQGVGVVPWMVPGTRELAEATCDFMETTPLCVWTQHGVIASGSSFDEAFGRVHTVEKAAGMYLAARSASGGAEPKYLVSDEHLRQVCDRYDIVPNEDYLEDDSFI